MTDLAAARSFVHTYGRLLERRRVQHLLDGAPEGPVVSALLAYRNPDGGIGALEPDLRTPGSQPLPTRAFLDVLRELSPTAATRSAATDAVDWLASVTNPDGGVPFVLPSGDDQPAAPWLVPSPGSSLLATTQLAAAAHRLGLDHPWLRTADDYCWAHADEVSPADAYTFRFFVDFLDAAPDRGRADEHLARLRALLPDDGTLAVAGGSADESLGPLALAPWPGHAGARLLDPAALGRAVDALEAAQQEDGGWDFTWQRWNPAGAWEWRGVVTVEALCTLRAYRRL